MFFGRCGIIIACFLQINVIDAVAVIVTWNIARIMIDWTIGDRRKCHAISRRRTSGRGRMIEAAAEIVAIAVAAIGEETIGTGIGIENAIESATETVTAIGEEEAEVVAAVEVVIGTGNEIGWPEWVTGVSMSVRQAKSITTIVRRRFPSGKNQRNGSTRSGKLDD